MFMRKIRLFFVQYGRLLLFIIGSIVIFIYLLKSANNYYKETYTVNQITPEEKQAIYQKKQEEEISKKIISKFIDNCNNGKIEEAYNMLTEDSKKEKYKSVDDFRSTYINKLFNIKIYEYKIEKQNETYVVYLTEDMLITGKTESTKQTEIKPNDNKIIIIR